MSDLIHRQTIWFGGNDRTEASMAEFYEWLREGCRRRELGAPKDVPEKMLQNVSEDGALSGRCDNVLAEEKMQIAKSQLSLEPMGSVLGARVHGLDLSKPYGDDVKRELREAFAHHLVLCVPGQDLSYDDQVRFASVFGKADEKQISKDEKGEGKSRERGVMYVTNIRENGKQVGSLPDGEMQFHSDGSHRDIPYRATSLWAMQVPSRGGETKFANLYAAYDALPESTKLRIEGKQCKFIYQVDATFREQTREDDPTLSNAVHPLVKVHPDTGRKSLYLSRLMTRYIIGMDRAESEALLADLFDHAEKPEFVYAHPWKPKDIVIWDNRCTNHARNDFPADELRQLRRITVSEPGDTSASSAGY